MCGLLCVLLRMNIGMFMKVNILIMCRYDYIICGKEDIVF